jgi:NAD(P)H-hydrate epimerase
MGPEAAEPILAEAERAAAVVLGPGLGRSREAFALARILASKVPAPLVIDADALNAHAGGLVALAAREAPTVLTPHAGELGRLLERDSDAISARRLESAREAATAAGAIVVLKGDDTLIVDPDVALAINGLSSPALATAGFTCMPARAGSRPSASARPSR